MNKNIVLVGFMGSGKTSVGKRLSIKLKREFIDMDDFIEKREGMTINEIFATKGEAYFRELEAEICQRYAIPKGKIIATGGGVIKNPVNVENLKKGGVIYYLKSSAEKVADNLKNDNSRPLLNVEDKLAKIKELMAEREQLYLNCADKILEVTNLNPEESCNIIMEEMGL